MTTSFHFDIRPQPNNTTCGPTCLHAVYRYFDDPIDLTSIIAEVPTLDGGGTLSVYLANHALRRGYRTTIIPYNLQIFDPTWSDAAPGEIAEKLSQQRAVKPDLPEIERMTDAYLNYLQLGGRLKFKVLTVALIRHYLKSGIPIMTGLSATYLYNTPREYDVDDHVVYDDVRGESVGHFVVLAGYDRETRRALVTDPFLSNPMADGQHYRVGIDRLVCAIMLGILTHDGDLLIIQPPKTKRKGALACTSHFTGR